MSDGLTTFDMWHVLVGRQAHYQGHCVDGMLTASPSMRTSIYIDDCVLGIKSPL